VQADPCGSDDILEGSLIQHEEMVSRMIVTPA